ncbi:hypothetical protein RE474_05200 [Methanolobus sediminis]|uniref:Uncharacterized protein n=1 Tax=Methanolobus sediminis TaxID=3072978 RepID=A0AA51UMM7_9EURY|nr:hypothetical protein [Methanolobus sediminis]WMW26119.1 hypothetical protein RE474_05200 [Methanolobus sediminis]
MANTDILKENSQAIQAHLGIMQSVIQRMAANSASCKTWCITLVSGILVILTDENKSQNAFIALVPIILFFSLDTYYLALERMFRQSYNNFIEKLHTGNIQINDLYVVTPTGSLKTTFATSIASFSVWPFYLTLVAVIIIVKKFIIE